jgi:SAM-dependent methyltransferase
MFDWTDLTRGIAAEVLGNPPRVAVQLAKARLLQSLANRGRNMDVQGFGRVTWLAGRSLPSLKFIIDHLPERSRVIDLGAGYGRHSFSALNAGHDVWAIERNETVCDVFRRDLATSGLGPERVNLIQGDYMDVSAESLGIANLVVATGILQHACDVADLRRRLEYTRQIADQPAAVIYIEMLFDMLFDGVPAEGRVAITPSEFETLLLQIFPGGGWDIEEMSGPQRQLQVFDQGDRSFHAPAKRIESITAEYAIRRLE